MTIHSAIRAIVLTLLTLSMLGTAFAQDEGSPSSQAVIAFMNILDHETVIETEIVVGTDPIPLALELLDHLERSDILAPDISQPLRTSMAEAVVDRKGFVLYLADLLNGFEVLETRDAGQAELMLEERYCGLVIPEGIVPEDRSDPALNNAEVGVVVQQFIDNFECILPSLRDTYRNPVE